MNGSKEIGDRTGCSRAGNTVAEKRVDFSYNALGQFATIARYSNRKRPVEHVLRGRAAASRE